MVGQNEFLWRHLWETLMDIFSQFTTIVQQKINQLIKTE